MRIVAVAAALLVFLFGPLAAEAQEKRDVYRLGVLAAAVPPEALAGIAMGLRGLGYVEGRNLIIERRVADGKLDRVPGLARELVRLRVDAILAIGNEAIQAAKEATQTIPIVMGFGNAPVQQGFVTGLARPGGNVTGVAYSPDDVGLAPKRLELLKEAVPQASRIAVLATGEHSAQQQIAAAQRAAAPLGATLVVVEVRNDHYDDAFLAIATERASALLVPASPMLFRHRKRIIDLAARHKLPAIYEWREHAEDGGLMAYGSSVSRLYGRVLAYVDRIFKGATPAELPVEQPTTFEFVINLKTAKALGLAMPPSLLLRADHVVE